MSHVPWYKRALPEQWNGLRAADWRRQQEATLFRSRNDPDVSSKPGDLFEDRAEQARTDPRAGSNLASGRQTLQERQRAKEEALEEEFEATRGRSTMVRAFDRPRTPTEELPTELPREQGRVSLGDIAGSIIPGIGGGTPARPDLDVAGLTNPRLPGGETRLFERPEDVNPALAAARLAGRVAEDVDRFGGATRAAIIKGPSGEAALAGARDPSAFPGTALPGVRDIEDPLLRGAVGLAGEVLLDPLDVVTGAPLVADLARGGVRLSRAANALLDPDVLHQLDPTAAVRAADETFFARTPIAGGAPTPEFNRARDQIIKFLDESEALDPTKAGEIRGAQGQRFRSMEDARAEAARRGLRGDQALEFITQAGATGRRFETVAPAPNISIQGRVELVDKLVRTSSATEFDQVKAALGEVFGERRVQPAQRDLLRRLLTGTDPTVAPGQVLPGARIRPRRGATPLPGGAPRTPATAGPDLVGRTRRGGRGPIGPMQIGPPTPERVPPPNVGAELAAQIARARRAFDPSRLKGGGDLPAGGTALPGTEGPPLGPPTRAGDVDIPGLARGPQPVPDEPISASAIEQLLDVLNIPRTVKSAFDLSSVLRQAGPFAARRPDLWAANWKPALRALRNPEEARLVDEIKWGPDNPKAERRLRAGVEHTDLNAVSGAAREEPFASQLAQNIPGVGASGRHFTAFMNGIRADMFDEFIGKFDETFRAERNLIQRSSQSDALKAQALEALDEAHLQTEQDLATFTNVFSGRTNIGTGGIARLLTSLFFSPQLWASRFRALRMGLPGSRLSGAESPEVRRLAQETLGAFFGEGMAIIGAGVAMGLWETEVDPRSSDFGQIRIGPTRIDIWAGFRPVLNSLARAGASFTDIDSKKLTSGKTVDIPLIDLRDFFGSIAGETVRGKLAPFPSAITDQFLKTDIVGEEVGDLTTPSGVMSEFADLFTPLSLDDIAEGIQVAGAKGGIIAGSSLFGPGTSSFLTGAEQVEMARSESVQQLPVEQRGGATTFEELVQEVGTARAIELVETIENPELDRLSEERLTDLLRRVQEEKDPLALQQLTSIRAKEKLFKADAESASNEDYRLRAREIQATAREFREGLEEINDIERDPPDNPVDAATEEWFQQFETCDVVGRTDSACMNREQAAFIERNGEALYDKVLDNIYSATGDLPERERERRTVTKQLTQADFFDIDQSVFEALKNDPRANVREAFGPFETYVDWRLAQIREDVRPEDFDDPEVAFQFAEQDVRNNRFAQRHDAAVQEANRDWARENPELAQQAISWGYMSASFLNIRASGARATR